MRTALRRHNSEGNGSLAGRPILGEQRRKAQVSYVPATVCFGLMMARASFEGLGRLDKPAKRPGAKPIPLGTPILLFSSSYPIQFAIVIFSFR